MHFFIDRRQNPKDKSLVNRQKFMRRARAQIKEVVNRSVTDRNISDVDSGKTISIPSKGISEPRFRHANTGGRRDRLFPGNKEFSTGDKVKKPPSGGQGKGGKEGADDGDGEDEFQFALSREEFLELFFEDLELPDLVKTDLKEVCTLKPYRAGLTSSGTPTNINLLRSMRNAYGRRLALKRPSSKDLNEIAKEILELEGKAEPEPEERQRLAELHKLYEDTQRKRRTIPFIDPFDIRYNYFEQRPEPNTKAVMFCLMDVSGSMGEREKDLAKRFFILLHLFLKRRYERIDVVFIRHTHLAQEVDEETFFYSRETGGTVVSTALTEMMKVLRDRYSVNEWNIYAAQASDGENFSGDTEKCMGMLDSEIMPLCQYYAYVEILDEREMQIFQNSANGTALWQGYRAVGDKWANFAMKRIAQPGDIYPVFRELFATDQAAD